MKPNNVSYSKILPIATDTPRQSDPDITGYRLIDVEILSQTLKALSCPECKCEHFMLHERFAEKGVSSALYMKCEVCDYEKEFNTSKTYSSKQTYDINSRMIYAMRSIGRGYSVIEKFATYRRQ
eukprot:TCONS_00021402-protein